MLIIRNFNLISVQSWTHLRGIGLRRETSRAPIVCVCLQLVPRDAHPLGVFQKVSVPGVSRSASSPFPLGVQRRCLSCGTSHRLPQRVSCPSPFPSSHFCWDLFCPFPQANIAGLVWPVHPPDSPEAAIDERLYFGDGSFCYLPNLGTIK